MRIFLASLLTAAVLATPAHAQMKDGDRQRLLAHFEMTESWLVSELQGLSQAQLSFRMTPQSWSIMDVVEHLAVAEPQYWERVQNSMKQPPTIEKLEGTDAGILWYGIDRTNRELAIAPEMPRGQLRDLQAGLANYRKHHARLLQYIKTTKDDLRNRVVERQRCDAYQWALLISTHEQRHILQIREIKTDSGFPRR